MRTRAPGPGLLLAAAAILGGPTACSVQAPDVEIHYLGHASFLLSFPDGPTVLTDYGASNAWGLDSPVYPLENLRPDVVTRSHEHLDHAGGTLPARIPVLLTGADSWTGKGLEITPIPTFEAGLSEPDNFGFLFRWKGLKILHTGDCQGLMVALGREEGSGQAAGSGTGGSWTREEVRSRIRELYPDDYDLVFLPIGFTRDILDEAANFLALIHARQVIPMHFWRPDDREAFLRLLEGRRDSSGRAYRTRQAPGPGWVLSGDEEEGESVLVVGLVPGAPGSGGSEVAPPDPGTG